MELKDISKMNTVQKATYLNQLITERYPSTIQEEDLTLDKIINCYNKDTYLIMDSLIWKLYSIHYSEFVDFLGNGQLGVNIIRLEKAIDTGIKLSLKELQEPLVF